MTGELVAFVVVVGVVAAVGIGLGILAAPTLTHLADRLGSDDDEERDGR